MLQFNLLNNMIAESIPDFGSETNVGSHQADAIEDDSIQSGARDTRSEFRLMPGTQGETQMTNRNFQAMFRGKPPLDEKELERLTDKELSLLVRNHDAGIVINSRFRRSRYYPLPRDLSFSAEKPLFRKWAADRQNLVEIGVFEGASARIFRSVMSGNGTLHLIDPFVVIPDSALTARPWMARLNLLLSSRNGTVQWYRDYSDKVAGTWNQPIDFLFIDGDHSEMACRNDWENWHSFVAVNGVVTFHDARFGRETDKEWDGWPGPSRVVNDLFRGSKKLDNWEIVDEIGSAVVVRRVR